ncbi:MAG TPA: 16S rRNA (guanine(527)-N(7))-methyltransferase RsmG [Solirubrobacteraceae bacterium]|nr:16S rRNA (guanine(527)-N(7))-methyltransferase RsmG [Solirubrobacteraceae bacterium]
MGARHRLGEAAVRRLNVLLELVVADPAAPTTVTTAGAVLRDHLADSLVALDLDCVRTAVAVADIGAGAGFPGLPLAIALPEARMSLVESSGRKCEFIGRAAGACGLANAEVVNARAEEWPAGRGRCALVVARAVAALPVVAEYAAPLLQIGGTLLAWRGRRDLEDERRAARVATLLGLEVAPPIKVEPYPGALNRHLHPIVKVAETPPEFPRRAGMARKRPLG